MQERLDKLDAFLNDSNKTGDKIINQSLNDYYCKKCKKNYGINDFNNGFVLCKNCGLVLKKIINVNAEWRFYGVNDSKSIDPTRCGAPINPLLPKSSLGTYISGNRYGSLQRLHSWSAMPSNERSLWEEFQKINRFTQNSDISKKIIDKSKYYYKMISEKDPKLTGILTRGNVRIGILAACVYISCKNNKIPRRASEIAELFEITTSDVTRGLKKFVEIEKKKNIQININQINAHDFIYRFSSKLNISEHHRKIAHIINNRSQKLGILKGNTPPSIAAGIIYLISDIYELKIPKSLISDYIDVSEVTLNKTYKKLEDNKSILLIGLI